MRRDITPPERRLAYNMLDYNPVASQSLVQFDVGRDDAGRRRSSRRREADPKPPVVPPAPFITLPIYGNSRAACSGAPAPALYTTAGNDARQLR
jgi:hypothetical protein